MSGVVSKCSRTCDVVFLIHHCILVCIPSLCDYIHRSSRSMHLVHRIIYPPVICLSNLLHLSSILLSIHMSINISSSIITIHPSIYLSFHLSIDRIIRKEFRQFHAEHAAKGKGFIRDPDFSLGTYCMHCMLWTDCTRLPY